MSAHSLSERLQRIKSEGSSSVVPGSSKTTDVSHLDEVPADSSQSADLTTSPSQELSVATEHIPDVSELPTGWVREGRFLWCRELHQPSSLPMCIDSLVFNTELFDTSKMIFLDVESTGLSSGAGSIAFLVGTARIVDSVIVVKQFFLSDFPGEIELLHRLNDELSEDLIITTYNGSSFDLPLLGSRYTMNRLCMHSYAQLDLLHWVRRFWKSRLTSCRLTDVENELLGIRREQDIPSSLVPELYFQFLEDNDPSSLGLVFEHHLQDVISLHRIYNRIEKTLSESDPDDVDPVALGRWFLGRDTRKAERILRRAGDSGNAAAGVLLGAHLKRSGGRGAAVPVWELLWSRSKHERAGVELAMYYEHTRRDFERALTIVEELAASTDPPPGIVYRKERLLRKLERR